MKKERGIPLISILLLLILFGMWQSARKHEKLPSFSVPAMQAADYGESEKVMKALSLSYLCYGCEGSDRLSGNVNELLENHTMGIIAENFGILRTDAEKPESALFDTAEFIRREVGSFRFLCDSKNMESGFYGAAFCDDAKRTVWVAYAGSVSMQDAIACAGLAFKPGFTAQEKEAFALFDTVLKSDEVANRGYSVVLTGHSLGGAFAAMVSRMTGVEAVTVNGADGLAMTKLNGMYGKNAESTNISNYLTKPLKKQISLMGIVQMMMFIGDKSAIDNHVYEHNGLTADPHCAFSFIRFAGQDFTDPILPQE